MTATNITEFTCFVLTKNRFNPSCISKFTIWFWSQEVQVWSAHIFFCVLLQGSSKLRAIYREGSDLRRVERIFSYYADNASNLFNDIEWIKADLNDIPALETAFVGISHVYHAAALISFNPSDYKQLKKINTDGTANIVNLCLAFKIQKLCYVSTIGTIGKSITDSIATEENEWNEQDVNVYALSKYAAENGSLERYTRRLICCYCESRCDYRARVFGTMAVGELFSTANKGYSFYPPGGTGFITVKRCRTNDDFINAFLH